MSDTKSYSKRSGIKMADIAEMAGVSRSAVSAVINDRPSSIRVSDQTRQKIQKIIRQTGFRSNALGQALASGKSYLLGLILESISNSFMPRCIEAIEDVAETYGYGVLLMSTRGNDTARQTDIMDFVANKWVDGIILTTDCETDQNTREFLRERNTPVVYLGYSPKNALPNSSTVCVNGKTIGYLGMKHILKAGHRYIACVRTTDWIKEGIDKTIKDFGNEKAEIEYWSCNLSVPDNMQEIFDRWDKASVKPSAIFFNGDRPACEFMNIALRAGVRIPDDVAIIGVNDIPEASKAVYPLTTIRQPKYEQAEIACKLLFDMIDGKPPKSVLLEPELVVRESA